MLERPWHGFMVLNYLILSCALTYSGHLGKTMRLSLGFPTVFMLELPMKCICISIHHPKVGARARNSVGGLLWDDLPHAAASRGVGDWGLLSSVLASHQFSAGFYWENS